MLNYQRVFVILVINTDGVWLDVVIPHPSPEAQRQAYAKLQALAHEEGDNRGMQLLPSGELT